VHGSGGTAGIPTALRHHCPACGLQPGSGASLPRGKQLREGEGSGEEKSLGEVGRKEACSVWGTEVCRQLSFVIAVVRGTCVFMTKKKACKKSFLHRSLSLFSKSVCTS